VKIIGHRGAAGHAPENTLRSVAVALDLGVHGVEVDVHLVEGRLVVVHDDRLERTTNGRGRVADARFADVRALDAGGGERVPTLDEVAALVLGRAELVVELKGEGTAAAVAAFLDGLPPARRRDVIVSSFDHPQLAELRALASDVRLGALVAGVPLGLARFATELGAHAVHMSLECLRAAMVRDAHARGLEAWVYTVNHADDVALCARLGVDAVFSDYPERGIR
jgi:glycerophosphoryl diester phosphodiesterase